MGSLSRSLAFLRGPSLLRQAGIYTVSNLAGKAVPFLLLPVLTRFMSPSDYGIVSMFLLCAILLDPFVSLGLVGAITVKYYDKTTDLASYLGTGVAVVAIAGAVILCIVFLFRAPLSDVTQVPATWLLLVIPLVLARTFGGSLLALLRVREQALLFSLAANLQTGGVIVLSLVLVAGLGLQWRGRIEAELLSGIGFAILAMVALRRIGVLRLRFVRPYARHLAMFGIPLIPHTLGSVLIVQTDRLFLTNLVGVGETGLYTVGYQLALVIELVAVAFNNAYTPWLFRTLTGADDRDKRRLVRYTYLEFALMAVFATVVAVAMPWIASNLLDRSFDGSGRYIGWFALGFLFSGMYYMVTNYIFYAQRTSLLAAVTITVAVINIPLTYLLINVNGGVGAAQATAISLGLSFLLTWVISQRTYPMPWFSFRERPASR